MRAPWSVNSLSLLAGEYVMDNYSMLFPDIEELLKESRCLQNEINKIKGLKVSKSDCNFFLCQIEGADTTVQELKEFLIENFGLLIRNASNFRDLTDKHFRLATQAPNVNMKLIEALKAWSRTLF